MTLSGFDDRDGFIWLNGSCVPWREARVHVLTPGLHYGSCVFDGERAYEGRIFRSRDHSQRLLHSAELLDMRIPYSLEEFEAAKSQILELAGGGEKYICSFAWRGSATSPSSSVVSPSPSFQASANASFVARQPRLRRCPKSAPTGSFPEE
jgi:branched-chain amino acid aminotransferase